jgi:hypothetical protein
LLFYEINSSNGKMTSDVYINQVLKGPVQSWIDRGDSFILEEDQDLGHGVGQKSAVRKVKESMGLDYFFNASGSPDLSPIENIWRAEKQQIKDFDHFDDESLVRAIITAWANISMDTINYIKSMVDRMQSLAERDGHVTEY